MLLLVNHGQEQLLVHHHLLVGLFRRCLNHISCDLRVDGGLGVLLLLGVVRRLGPLLFAFHELDGHLLVRFDLLVRYYLRKRWLQLQRFFRLLIVDRVELFQVFGRLMHRQQLDLLLLNIIGSGHLLDIDLFDRGQGLLGWLDQR